MTKFEDQLLGQPDQIHRGEFGARRLVAVVVQHIEAGAAQLAVKIVARRGAFGIARPQVDQAEAERCDAFRPDDAGIVVVSLDQRADEARHADAVGPHLERDRLAIGSGPASRRKCSR